MYKLKNSDNPMCLSEPFAIQFAESEEGELIQIFRQGKYNHLFYGEINLTKKIFESMVRNFKAGTYGIDIMLDYDHRVEEAAAWIKKLMVLKDEKTEKWGLWAKVDWVEEGKASVDSKKFRYISGDFTMNYVGNESDEEFGPLLYGAALTNRPFIKQMEPVRKLNDINGGQGMTLEEAKAEIKVLKETNETLETAQKNQVKQLNEKIDSQKGKILELEQENAKLNEEKVAKTKEDEFSKLLSEGKAVPAQKEAFLANDMIKFAELSKEVNTDPQGNGENGKDTDELTEDEKHEKCMELAEKKLTAGECDSIGQAISIVLSEKPELAAKN